MQTSEHTKIKILLYKPKKDSLKDTFILEKIGGIATVFPSYGYRRITAALKREGMVVNHKRVYRIMRANGICCSIGRSFKATTNSKTMVLPNILT